MVMRAISSFSVGPTVSESMLIAKRRASEATRFSTPGLFSTYATSVCIAVSSLEFARSRFHQRVGGTANHLVQRSARRHHRIHRIFLLHAKIDQHGFG